MKYLVFASDDGPDGQWRIGERELSSLVLQDWPDAVVQEPTPADAEAEGRGFRWVCHVAGNEMEAWINKDGTCLFIEGEFDGVVQIATWFRRKMPQDVEFSICDDVYSFVVVIEFGVTAREVAASIPD